MDSRVYRTRGNSRLRYHGASKRSGPKRTYRGGVRTETAGSWADIKLFVPGTQGDPCLGTPLPQSARSDVG